MRIGEHKIIFTGPVGAGKTAAINCLSDAPVVGTDVAATDETLEKKASTTVAMDYGYIQLEQGEVIHLYGTPGQERFDFMWQILCQGGIGLVLLVDATSKSPVADCEFYLKAFDEFIQKTGAVIGITRADIAENTMYEQVLDLIVDKGYPIPVLEIDAREEDDVKMLVHALLAVL